MSSIDQSPKEQFTSVIEAGKPMQDAFNRKMLETQIEMVEKMEREILPLFGDEQKEINQPIAP